jgi:hypothetical protein
MSIQVQGNGGTVAEVDGTNFRAVRVTPRPIDYGTLGHYRIAQNIALVVTQAANGSLFSFRWGDATRLCVVSKIRLTVVQTAVQTATIFTNFQVFLARSFTVSDSVGTAVTLTGNNMKKRTSMGTTLVTDMRFSAVAAGLTAGTRTLDAAPILEMPTQQLITTLPTFDYYVSELEIGAGDGNHPIVLAQNEGFIVRGPTVAFGAAGTANLVVEVSWAEVTAY